MYCSHLTDKEADKVTKKTEVRISNRLVTETGLEPSTERDTHITCMQIIAAFLFPTQVKPPDDSQVIPHFVGYLITIAASVMGLLSGTFPRLSKMGEL